MSTEKENGLFDNVKRYVDLKAEYLKLDLTEKFALFAGKLILLGVLGLMGVAVLMLLLLFFNAVLVKLIGIEWLATLIEIALMLVVIAATWHYRERLIFNPIANSIIRTFFDNDKSTKENGNDKN
jgi:K+ transporter